MKKIVKVGGSIKETSFSRAEYKAIISQYGSGIFGSPKRLEIEIQL